MHTEAVQGNCTLLHCAQTVSSKGKGTVLHFHAGWVPLRRDHLTAAASL